MVKDLHWNTFTNYTDFMITHYSRRSTQKNGNFCSLPLHTICTPSQHMFISLNNTSINNSGNNRTHTDSAYRFTNPQLKTITTSPQNEFITQTLQYRSYAKNVQNVLLNDYLWTLLSTVLLTVHVRTQLSTVLLTDSQSARPSSQWNLFLLYTLFQITHTTTTKSGHKQHIPLISLYLSTKCDISPVLTFMRTCITYFI
jgi:hypothetical protein